MSYIPVLGNINTHNNTYHPSTTLGTGYGTESTEVHSGIPEEWKTLNMDGTDRTRKHIIKIVNHDSKVPNPCLFKLKDTQGGPPSHRKE